MKILIILFAAMIVEFARRYFILYRYCGEKIGEVQVFLSMIIIGSMAFSSYVYDDLFAVVAACLIDAAFSIFFVVAQLERLKAVAGETKKEWRIRSEIAVFYASYAIPLIFCLIRQLLWA